MQKNIESLVRAIRLVSKDNLANLVELRKRIRCSRETFNKVLHAARVAGRVTMSLAEGRHGITPEERAAGILDGEGQLLLFASVRG